MCGRPFFLISSQPRLQHLSTDAPSWTRGDEPRFCGTDEKIHAKYTYPRIDGCSCTIFGLPSRAQELGIAVSAYSRPDQIDQPLFSKSGVANHVEETHDTGENLRPIHIGHYYIAQAIICRFSRSWGQQARCRFRHRPHLKGRDKMRAQREETK